MSRTYPGLLCLPPDLSYRWLLALPEGRGLPWDPEPRELQRRPHHPRERQERQGWCRRGVREGREDPGDPVCPPYQAVLVFRGCRASQSVPANISSNTARLLHSDNSPSDLARRTCPHLPASREPLGLPSRLEVPSVPKVRAFQSVLVVRWGLGVLGVPQLRVSQCRPAYRRVPCDQADLEVRGSPSVQVPQ